MPRVEAMTDEQIAAEIAWLAADERRYPRCIHFLMERAGELVIERERRAYRRRTCR